MKVTLLRKDGSCYNFFTTGKRGAAIYMENAAQGKYGTQGTVLRSNGKAISLIDPDNAESFGKQCYAWIKANNDYMEQA